MRIALVNMPFAALETPSIALTQLRTVLRADLGPTVEVDLHYLNHDFGRFFGQQRYQELASRMDHLYTGIGDWLFRHIAFPDAADNPSEYFRRFYPRPDRVTNAFRSEIQQKRDAIDSFLDRLIANHQLLTADVVGFTSMFAQSVACFAMARKLKTKQPHIVTIIGGANCEGTMGRAIAAAIPPIDFVFSGPGLRSLPELIRRIRDSDHGGRPIAGVLPGAASLPARQLVREVEEDLGKEKAVNETVALDYTSFLTSLDEQFPFGAVKPTLLFETSRGCWWGQKAHCTFCGLNGSSMSYRSMEPEAALMQFRELFRYATRCKRFDSVDNILPKSYLTDVLPELDTPQGVTIFYEVKADLTWEEVQRLAAARVNLIQPGIEALATSTLKLMRKGTSAFTNLRLLLACRHHGVTPIWNLLMGFPGEEESVFAKYLRDIPTLYHLMPPSGAFPVRFDRFSPYFVQHEAFGLDLHPMDMYAYVYPLDPIHVREMAYYFTDRRFGSAYQVAMRKMLAPVKDAVARWRERFEGVDGGVPADLAWRRRGQQLVIWDSRSGHAVEHSVSNNCVELLNRCCQVTHVTDIDCQPELEWVRERGLIFQEGDRVMSVIGSAPRIVATATSTAVRRQIAVVN